MSGVGVTHAAKTEQCPETLCGIVSIFTVPPIQWDRADCRRCQAAMRRNPTPAATARTTDTEG
jgi:uncharacterized paraquat-inducible protein A